MGPPAVGHRGLPLSVAARGTSCFWWVHDAIAPRAVATGTIAPGTVAPGAVHWRGRRRWRGWRTCRQSLRLGRRSDLRTGRGLGAGRRLVRREHDLSTETTARAQAMNVVHVRVGREADPGQTARGVGGDER